MTLPYIILSRDSASSLVGKTIISEHESEAIAVEEANGLQEKTDAHSYMVYGPVGETKAVRGSKFMRDRK